MLVYAAKFDSKRVIGLVFVDGIVGVDPSVSFYQSMIDQWMQFQMDRKGATEKFTNIVFKQPQEESYLKRLAAVALKTPTNTVMTLINNYILQDFRSLLPEIKVPSFIATIEGPRLDYMQKMNRMLPHSQLEIFPSAGHAIFVDQPERFNASLDKFISSLR